MASQSRFKHLNGIRVGGICLLAFAATYLVAAIVSFDDTDAYELFFMLFCLLLILTSLPMIFIGNFKTMRNFVIALWENFFTP